MGVRDFTSCRNDGMSRTGAASGVMMYLGGGVSGWVESI